jgi:hypothetical protein
MKTALHDARKRVAEAEAQCAQQAELLEAMEAQGSSPDAINAAARMLDILDRVLALMRAHLQREEDLQPDRIVQDSPTQDPEPLSVLLKELNTDTGRSHELLNHLGRSKDA